MHKLLEFLSGKKASEQGPQEYPIQKVEVIGHYDQLRVTTQDADGDINGFSIFRDGSAMKSSISVAEHLAGEPLHKVHFRAGSAGAKSVITQLDDSIKDGDHNVKRAIFTLPHLPERRAALMGDLTP